VHIDGNGPAVDRKGVGVGGCVCGSILLVVCHVVISAIY